MEDMIAHVQGLLPGPGEALDLPTPLADGERYEVIADSGGELPRELVVSVSTARTEPLMTPGDLATLLNKPRSTLAQWRSKRIGPPYLKLENGSVRYEPEAIREWLQKQSVRA